MAMVISDISGQSSRAEKHFTKWFVKFDCRISLNDYAFMYKYIAKKFIFTTTSYLYSNDSAEL